MTITQIESQCRNKADDLIAKHFSNINHEAAIERPETIGYHSLELSRQIEAEYYDYLKSLWSEVAPNDPRTFEQIIDKRHLSELMTEDDRDRIHLAYDDAKRHSLWECLTKTNHKDIALYRSALKTCCWLCGVIFGRMQGYYPLIHKIEYLMLTRLYMKRFSYFCAS